jgi:hypothetical protein
MVGVVVGIIVGMILDAMIFVGYFYCKSKYEVRANTQSSINSYNYDIIISDHVAD